MRTSLLNMFAAGMCTYGALNSALTGQLFIAFLLVLLAIGNFYFGIKNQCHTRFVVSAPKGLNLSELVSNAEKRKYM